MTFRLRRPVSRKNKKRFDQEKSNPFYLRFYVSLKIRKLPSLSGQLFFEFRLS
jgi:hypothetical protein